MDADRPSGVPVVSGVVCRACGDQASMSSAAAGNTASVANDGGRIVHHVSLAGQSNWSTSEGLDVSSNVAVLTAPVSSGRCTQRVTRRERTSADDLRSGGSNRGMFGWLGMTLRMHRPRTVLRFLHTLPERIETARCDPTPERQPTVGARFDGAFKRVPGRDVPEPRGTECVDRALKGGGYVLPTRPPVCDTLGRSGRMRA